MKKYKGQYKAWLPPLLLLVLLGCAQPKDTDPVAVPQPTVVVASSPLTLQVQVQDAEVTPGQFITVPIEIQAQASTLKAVEAQLSFDPEQLSFVGLQADETGLGEALEVEDGQVLLTGVLNQATTKTTLQAVFQLRTTVGSSVAVAVREALDDQNRAVGSDTQTTFQIRSGTGGTLSSPVLPSLSEQVLRMQRAAGLIQSQSSTPLQLQVPAVPDATWVNFEAGDLTQDGKVDLADTAKLATILLGVDVPTPYQAFAGDLDDRAVAGKQVLTPDDFVAMLLKRALMILGKNKSLPVLHPLKLQASLAQPALLMVGNAGLGALGIQVSGDQPWISIQPLPQTTAVQTRGFRITADAPQGSAGNVILTSAGGLKRLVPLTALASTVLPYQVLSQQTAKIETACVFSRNRHSILISPGTPFFGYPAQPDSVTSWGHSTSSVFARVEVLLFLRRLSPFSSMR